MSENIVSTPTRERCVTSYAARTQYKPGEIHPPHIKVKDAIDIHCHAHEGQQNPYDLARRASLAEMKGILFKSVPGDDPAKTVRSVQDDVNRWAEKEQVEPVQCCRSRIAGTCDVHTQGPSGPRCQVCRLPSAIVQDAEGWRHAQHERHGGGEGVRHLPQWAEGLRRDGWRQVLHVP